MSVPHFALPFRVDGTGRVATVEQDTVDDIAQCVAVLMLTPVGSRVTMPTYGTPRPEFAGPDPAGIVAAVAEWEPRADVTVDAVSGVGFAETVAAVAVQVRPLI